MENNSSKRCASIASNRNFRIESRISKSRCAFRTCQNSAQEENAQLRARIRYLEQLLSSNKTTINKNSDKSGINIGLPSTRALKSESFTKVSGEKQRYALRLKETVHMLQKEVNKLKTENFGLKEEVTKLVKNNKDSLIVSKVFRACLCNAIDIEELWFIINPNSLDTVSALEFQRGIRGIYLNLKEKEVNKLFLMLCQGEGTIDKRQFIFQMHSLKPSLTFTLEDLKKPLERMKKIIRQQEIAFIELLDKNIVKKTSSFKFVYEKLKEILPEAAEDDVEIVTRGLFGCFLVLDSDEVKKTLINFINMF